jgi:hypothetical protein
MLVTRTCGIRMVAWLSVTELGGARGSQVQPASGADPRRVVTKKARAGWVRSPTVFHLLNHWAAWEHPMACRDPAVLSLAVVFGIALVLFVPGL